MIVKTKVGEISCPDSVGPRTRYWAEALQDLLKVDELYGVVGAALEEAFEAGQRAAFFRLFSQLGEVIDATATVVEGSEEEVEGEGSEPEGAAVPAEGPGPVEPTPAPGQLPGSVPEGAGSLGGD